MTTAGDPAAGVPGRRLGRDATYAVLGRGASAALTFGAVFVATRILDPGGYGELSVLLVTVAVVYALIGSWTSAPMYTMAAEELQRSGTMGATASARLIAMAVVATTMAAMVIPVVSVTDWVDATPLAVAACTVAGLGSAWCEQATTLLETAGHFAAAAWVQLVRPASYLGGLLLVLAADSAGRDLERVLVTLLASWFVAIVVATAVALAWLPLAPLRTSRATLRRLWHTSAPLTIFAVSQLAFGVVDIYVVRIFRPVQDVGHYGLAYQCFSMAAFLASALPALIAPRLTRARAEGRDVVAPYLRVIGRTVLPWLAFAATAAIPWAPLAVRTVFGDEYAAAGAPLSILGLALLVVLGTSALGPVLLVAEATRVIGLVAAGALFVNATLDVLLLGVVGTGIEGAAWATLIACLVPAVAYTLKAAAISDTRLENPVVVLAPVLTALCGTLLLRPSVAMPAGALVALCFLLTMVGTGRMEVRLRLGVSSEDR